MPDTDWLGALSGLAQAGVGYVQQQMQFKQAKKLAKIQAGSGGGNFPMLGTGNMSYGYSSAPMALGQVFPSTGASGGVVEGGMLGQVYNWATGAQEAGGACSLFVPKQQAGFRALPVVMQQAPNGTYHYWRHVGTPVEFTRDRAICKAYLKRHGGSLRGRRRPY